MEVCFLGDIQKSQRDYVVENKYLEKMRLGNKRFSQPINRYVLIVTSAVNVLGGK